MEKKQNNGKEKKRKFIFFNNKKNLLHWTQMDLTCPSEKYIDWKKRTITNRKHWNKKKKNLGMHEKLFFRRL